MRANAWTAVLATALACGAAAHAEERSLAFMGLSAAPASAAESTKTLEETFLATLSSAGFFTRVVGRSDLATLLGYERMHQLAGCADSGCLAELAGALGVDYVAAAEMGRVGETTVVHLKVIEVKSAEVAARAMRKVVREDRLLDAVSELVRDAAGSLRERDIRLGRIRPVPSLALAFVPFGAGQFGNGSPKKGAFFLLSEVAAFGTCAVALAMFESQKLPGSGGFLRGGRFRDPDAAAALQTTYLASCWSGVALAAIGLVDALVERP